MWNRVIVLFLVSLLSISSYADDKKLIKQVDKLILKKKYETAFKKLDQNDPKNLKLDIFLKKYELATKYSISTQQYRSFAFKDFGKNENEYKTKINFETLHYYDFKIDLIFDSLLKTTKNNCELYQTASNFLFDINMKFGSNWVKPEGEYLKEMAVYSEKAINAKCANDQDYYKIGYYLINVGKYKESIYFLNQSVLKNDKNATAHYNLAFAYIMTKSPVSALKHSKKAFDLYTDSLYKSDASRMLAESYFQNNQVDSAIMFYEEAEKLDSTTINNLASLLNIYLKTSKSDKAEESFNKFFKLDPTNPTIYNQLEQIYTNNKIEHVLATKYEELLGSYSDNIEVLANLKYYLARLYSIENVDKAINTYLESKKHFEKIYKNDHPVFASIDKSIEQLKEVKK